MGGVCTKNWVLEDEDGKKHTVQLRHHSFSGRREVLVDGHVVISSTKFLDDGDSLLVEAGGMRLRVEIDQDNIGFTYALYKCASKKNAKDELVPDLSTAEIDGKNLPGPGMEGDAAWKDGEKLSVVIPDWDTEHYQASNSKAIVYNMIVTRGKKRWRVRKRFSEFYALNTVVRSAFVGHHLLANFPSFPPKFNKLMHDHFSPQLINPRRMQLEEYMQKLILVPRVVINPDFRRFLVPRTAKEGDLERLASFQQPASSAFDRDDNSEGKDEVERKERKKEQMEAAKIVEEDAEKDGGEVERAGGGDNAALAAAATTAGGGNGGGV